MTGHLDVGTLRFAYDDARSLTEAQRMHLASCLRCRERAEAVASRAAQTVASFDLHPAVPVAIGPARTALGARLAEPRRPARALRSFLPLSLVAAVACLLIAFATTPIRSVANDILAVFAPRAVAPIVLSAADVAQLRDVPPLTSFGAIRSEREGMVYEVPDLHQAALAVDFPVRVPALLPAPVPRAARYVVAGRSVTEFTFDAARAARLGATGSMSLPAMPPTLDGQTIEAGIGPIVVTSYLTGHERPATPSDALALATSTRVAGGPELAIVQLPVPEIVSGSVPAAAIESYVLRQPGISTHLAEQLLALGDLSVTLPIPLPIDRTRARPALVRGRSGITFVDDADDLSGAVWQEQGMLYLVYGRLPLGDVVAVAESLE